MSKKIKAVPLEDSDSDGLDNDDLVQKRIKLIRELSELEKPQDRFSGGIKISKDLNDLGNPKNTSLSASEKKGLKEVAELERELDLKNTFSRETNRRDEDAEMNKYIDEQIRLKREAAQRERRKLEENHRASNPEESELSSMFTLADSATDKVEDILLESISRQMKPTTDERNEAMLSSQMLNGIPEVDLGINERLRTIEATEEAKLQIAGSSRRSTRNRSDAPVNIASNFQQHRSTRDTKDGHLITSNKDRHNNNRNEPKVMTEAVVVVGEEPDEVQYRVPTSTGDRPPQRNKPSDEYYLTKFKKNSRR